MLFEVGSILHRNFQENDNQLSLKDMALIRHRSRQFPKNSVGSSNQRARELVPDSAHNKVVAV